MLIYNYLYKTAEKKLLLGQSLKGLKILLKTLRKILILKKELRHLKQENHRFR